MTPTWHCPWIPFLPRRPTLASPIIHYLGIPWMSPELAWMVAIFWIGRKFRCGQRGSWLISWFFISRWLADGSF